ncbi:MAG: hypothetical protein ACREJO_12185 [Phycisphaerales bacterium]
MAVYTLYDLAGNLSAFVAQSEARHECIRGHERGTTAPTIPVPGQLWSKSNYGWAVGPAADALMWCEPAGSTFQLFADPRYPQLNAGGTVAAAANLPMGGNMITGLADGSADGDAATVAQVVLADGTNPMTGDLDLDEHGLVNLPPGGLSMENKPIIDVGNPTNPTDAVNKAYADATASEWGTFAYAGSGAAVTVVSLGYTPSRVVVYFTKVSPCVHDTAAVNAEDIVTNAILGGTPFQSRLKRTATGFEYRTANNAGNVTFGPAASATFQAFK